MRPKIFLYGEVLVRYDFARKEEAQLFPVGSGLNVGASVAALAPGPVHLLTALSATRESELVNDFCVQNNLDLRHAVTMHGFLGSYHLYRSPTLFHWQVVYNRAQTPWSALMSTDQPFAKGIVTMGAGDYFYFDGISLLTHPRGWSHLTAIITHLATRQVHICFDFNLRATLAPRTEKMRGQLLTLLQNVHYLNIGLLDAQWLLSAPTLSVASLGSALSAALPRLIAFWGYTKTLEIDGLAIAPYYYLNGKMHTAQVVKFMPREQIGLGDAFTGYMLAQLVTQQPIDLKVATQWVMLKSQYYGDASVPSAAELASLMKGEGVIR